MRPILLALLTLAWLPASAFAQIQTLTCQVTGTIDAVDQGFHPGTSVGDPYTVLYTIEYDPLADVDPDPGTGRWTGPATVTFAAGTETIVGKALEPLEKGTGTIRVLVTLL